MLLLVMQPHFEHRSSRLQNFFGATVEQLLNSSIDMRSIGGDLIQTRPRQQTALRTRMARSDGDIVGIEQIAEALVEATISRVLRQQQKLFEKPRRVRAMPFRRARVRH